MMMTFFGSPEFTSSVLEQVLQIHKNELKMPEKCVNYIQPRQNKYQNSGKENQENES